MMKPSECTEEPHQTIGPSEIGGGHLHGDGCLLKIRTLQYLLYLYNGARREANPQAQRTHTSLQSKGYAHRQSNDVIADEVDGSAHVLST